ncbi:MAG: 3-deoxy-7-phosphoheptulonate synthase [Cyclobacteriaceae bacterium]|nr:3-deoxy-7-phosphoheptulonate synthase [Cyclobacteriaceae bacterium]
MGNFTCETDAVFPGSNSYLKAGRHNHPEGTVLDIGGIKIGGNTFVIMAGPCAVESEIQLLTTARAVRERGANILRGGAFKPRSSPYSFQGLEEEGLKLLRKARIEYGIPVITEVMDTRQVEMVCKYADILQIGSRNMQNFPLLKEAGQCRKPVLLKRGMNATLDELLLASEYILDGGNEEVMLCERGIRSFETSYRNTMDLNAIPVLKRLTHLPVIVDPSHGTGHAWMVPYLAKAALAVGADGLLVEVHYDPLNAMCDGPQSLSIEQFGSLINELKILSCALGKDLIVPEISFI